MNRFKDKTMRQNYDALVLMFNTGHRNLFNPSGARCYGNSWASFFWRGFDGVNFGAGFIDRESKATLAYSSYRAGQDCAHAARQAAIRNPCV